MNNEHINAEVVLSAPLNTNDTFTVAYPPGTTRQTFIRGRGQRITGNGLNLIAPRDFAITALGLTAATVTYRGAAPIPAGTRLFVELDAGAAPDFNLAQLPIRVRPTIAANPVLLELGAPIATAANGHCLSQALLAATVTGALLNGARAGVNDVPRNIVAAWTGTAVLTVDGFDEYGAPMREQSASGTSLTGVKAFARVTRVTTSADITGLTVGFGNVLGLPVFVPGAANLVREVLDLGAAAAGTLVAGLAAATASTANTADVRGTYAPAAGNLPDGSRTFGLLMWLDDPADRGNPQFAG